MSDHLVGGLVAGIEPPYYTVVFTSLRTDVDHGYGETAGRMEELVREVPGFLGYESARTPGGIGITVGYFRDEEAIVDWRSRLEHQSAQRQGRERWYESYSVHVAKVERSYSFQRPADQGTRHGDRDAAESGRGTTESSPNPAAPNSASPGPASPNSASPDSASRNSISPDPVDAHR
ncbi:antibiotic biosynthesis monooxygenase [Streptomyces sp. cg36]|uniref:antibiotic biosynthesis monooxygenase family protein n=1 Tax=Streptomyces sp. cg36 TaxID=3238798 RepID=UPI0034E23249